MNQSLLNETISKAALLGTERQPIAFSTDDSALGVAVSKLSSTEPNRAVLGAAALSALYHQVGQLPPNMPDVSVEPCDLDDLPRCTPRAEYYLSLILNGEYKDLLPEWLDAVAAAKRRVSERYLPELLEAGRSSINLRSRIALVLGKRGRWLASLNSEWNYAQLSLDFFNTDGQDLAQSDETWQSASRAARTAVITDLRTRDPERARAMVESTWAQDSADERAAFVNTLATGLTLADEPFLEKALDDRGKDVRRAAANVLATLSGSRLSQRMIERVSALITIKRNLIGKASLEVLLPETYDKAMERDGIEQKTYLSNFGEKGWWLTQMIGAIPLDHWTKAWKNTPEQCLLLATSNEWSAAFLYGWGLASRRGGDAAWNESILRYWMNGKTTLQQLEEFTPRPQSDELAEHLVFAALKNDDEPLHDAHPAVLILRRHRATWSPTLARAVIASIKRRMAIPVSQTRTVWQITGILPIYATRIPPELADEMTADWPEEEKNANNSSYWTGPVQKFCATVQIRHDMLNDIRSMKETDTNG